MRTQSVQSYPGRGMVRGLFACAALVFATSACDKSPDSKNATVDAAMTTAATATTPDGGVDVAVDVATELAEPEPVEISPPWKSASPPWEELKKSIADKQVGTLSGEMFGEEKPIRAIVRSHCGGGAVLQAVWEAETGLQVTPGMPVQFFDLATQNLVSYNDGNFDVTLNFEEDSGERLAGTFRIGYSQRGEPKTFIDMQVDGEPLSMLLRPRMPGEGQFPEFHSCHPSGRFYVRLPDGRETSGLLNATASKNGKALVATVLLDEQTGLRFVVGKIEEGWKGPAAIDLESPAADAPIRVLVESFHTPELTAASEAKAGNIGREKTSNVHRGTGTVTWSMQAGRPRVELEVTDLAIPVLLDGPLRGTTLSKVKIDAVAYRPGEYPTPPPTDPLRVTGEQE